MKAWHFISVDLMDKYICESTAGTGRWQYKAVQFKI